MNMENKETYQTPLTVIKRDDDRMEVNANGAISLPDIPW